VVGAGARPTASGTTANVYGVRGVDGVRLWETFVADFVPQNCIDVDRTTGNVVVGARRNSDWSGGTTKAELFELSIESGEVVRTFDLTDGIVLTAIDSFPTSKWWPSTAGRRWRGFRPIRRLKGSIMRINWSAFRSGILLGFAIAFSLAAGAIYMQGCQSTPEQQVANVQAREGVTAVAATVAADPKASESTKSVATKVDAVTKAAITPTVK
jgi:hypothetical protein